MNIFYATDGSWGDATDLVIFDTSGWSEKDETVFAELSEAERASYANVYGDMPHLRPTRYAALIGAL